jgi:hypothetical protein
LSTAAINFKDSISQPERQLYKFWFDRIVWRYKKANPDFMEAIEQINVGIEGPNAGLSAETHIDIAYTGHSYLDSLIAAHELGHQWFRHVMKGLQNWYKDANNFIHYAANQFPNSPYIHMEERKYYLTKLDVLRRRYTLLTVYYFDVDLILMDMGKIREDIRRGVAPRGPNAYLDYP